MTKDEIKNLAVECGFTLREQTHGALDLDPYVYDFAERLLAWNLRHMRTEGWRQCTKGQHTSQFCGQLEGEVLSEREACAAIADSYEDHAESDIAENIAYDIRKRGRK